MKYKHILPALLLVAPSHLLAQDLQDEWQKKKDASPWSGYISADYSRNAYKDNSPLANRSASMTGVVRYALGESSRLQLIASGYHKWDGNTYGSRGQFWSDTSISYAKSNLFKPTDDSSVSGELRVILPTSKSSRRNDLKVGTRAKLRWSAPFDNWLEGLTISNSLSVQKNFHEYKTAGGNQLIEYRVSNQLSLDYGFAEDFYINFYLMPRQSWNYQGNRLNPDLIWGSEIGYQVNKKISMSLGMTNGISYVDHEKGPDPINDLFDLDKSTYFVTVNYKL